MSHGECLTHTHLNHIAQEKLPESLRGMIFFYTGRDAELEASRVAGSKTVWLSKKLNVAYIDPGLERQSGKLRGTGRKRGRRTTLMKRCPSATTHQARETLLSTTLILHPYHDLTMTMSQSILHGLATCVLKASIAGCLYLADELYRQPSRGVRLSLFTSEHGGETRSLKNT